MTGKRKPSTRVPVLTKEKRKYEEEYGYPWTGGLLPPKLAQIAYDAVEPIPPGAVVVALQKTLGHIQTGKLNGWNISKAKDTEEIVTRFQHEIQKRYWAMIDSGAIEFEIYAQPMEYQNRHFSDIYPDDVMYAKSRKRGGGTPPPAPPRKRGKTK